MLSLEEKLGGILRERGLTISSAESCTGGRVGDKITDVPGSSDYFIGSAVTYSNESKITVLKVSEESIVSFGAVSEQVATEMASGCRALFGSSIAVSTTGIAGPSGGSPDKPVGLVWFAVSHDEGTTTEHAVFDGDRDAIKEKASIFALELLLKAVSHM